MGTITSKTHWYISIRRFPSEYYMKKFHAKDHKAHLKLIEVYKLYRDFFIKLIDYSLDNNMDYFYKNYFLAGIECAKEELHEKKGILIANCHRHAQFCIPKSVENKKIFNWILKNAPNSKILKRTNGSFYDHGPEKWKRETYKTKSDVLKLLNKPKLN